jgi:hypothetical protein
MATLQHYSPPEDPSCDSCPIKGMYHLFDLITEQGSSGPGEWTLSHRSLHLTHDVP